MSRHIKSSLRLQFFCSVMLSIFIALVVFGVFFVVGNILLEKTVYGYSFAKRMSEQQFEKLQTYVKEESISINNIYRLNAWCSRGEKVYLTVYMDDVLIYESPLSDGEQSNSELSIFDPELEDADNEYTLVLCGDIRVRAFLYYYAGDAIYFWMTILSGIVSFVVFSGCFIILISRKISYITALKQELDILSGGQLTYPVTVKGTDELGVLASGIDQMRRSIIKHQESETQMRTANSELITAVSHDLRTPLTSLLAYLEIIERKKYNDEAQMHLLVRKCINQTMRIKNMADQLFEYFWVYATEWNDAVKELNDADSLFSLIWEDYSYSMERNGLKVETSFTPVLGKIEVNTELLHRALDNLYSNILKYAEKEKNIRITYYGEQNQMVLCVSNSINKNRKDNKSTGIGLNTCKRIVQNHGGTFTTNIEDDVFSIIIKIPLQSD